MISLKEFSDIICLFMNEGSAESNTGYAAYIQEKLYISIVDRIQERDREYDLRMDEQAEFINMRGDIYDEEYFIERYYYPDDESYYQELFEQNVGLGDMDLDIWFAMDYGSYQSEEAARKKLEGMTLLSRAMMVYPDKDLYVAIPEIAELISYNLEVDPFHEDNSESMMVFSSKYIGHFLESSAAKTKSGRRVKQLVALLGRPFGYNYREFSGAANGCYYFVTFMGSDGYYNVGYHHLEPAWYLAAMEIKRRLDSLNEKYHFYKEDTENEGNKGTAA